MQCEHIIFEQFYDTISLSLALYVNEIFVCLWNSLLVRFLLLVLMLLGDFHFSFVRFGFNTKETAAKCFSHIPFYSIIYLENFPVKIWKIHLRVIFLARGRNIIKEWKIPKFSFFLVFSRFQSSPQTSKKTDDLWYYSNQFSLYKQRVTVVSIPHNIRKKEELYARLVCLLKPRGKFQCFCNTKFEALFPPPWLYLTHFCHPISNDGHEWTS